MNSQTLLPGSSGAFSEVWLAAEQRGAWGLAPKYHRSVPRQYQAKAVGELSWRDLSGQTAFHHDSGSHMHSHAVQLHSNTPQAMEAIHWEEGAQAGSGSGCTRSRSGGIAPDDGSLWYREEGSFYAPAPRDGIPTAGGPASRGKLSGVTAGDKHGSIAGRAGQEHDAPPTRERTSCADGAPAATTLVIRNLPAKLSHHELASVLDSSGFASSYHFVYKPITVDSKKGQTYAFVDFKSAAVASEFQEAWHNTRRFDNDRKLNVAVSANQGLNANHAKWSSTKTARIKNTRYQPLVRPVSRGGVEPYELPQEGVDAAPSVPVNMLPPEATPPSADSERRRVLQSTSMSTEAALKQILDSVLPPHYRPSPSAAENTIMIPGSVEIFGWGSSEPCHIAFAVERL